MPVTPCLSFSVEIAFAAESGNSVSRTISLVFDGSVAKDAAKDLVVSCSRSRTRATKVVSGRERMMSARPLPMPRLAPVTRYVVMFFFGF